RTLIEVDVLPTMRSSWQIACPESAPYSTHGRAPAAERPPDDMLLPLIRGAYAAQNSLDRSCNIVSSLASRPGASGPDSRARAERGRVCIRLARQVGPTRLRSSDALQRQKYSHANRRRPRS